MEQDSEDGASLGCGGVLALLALIACLVWGANNCVEAGNGVSSDNGSGGHNSR
jgi:hypothetical protein